MPGLKQKTMTQIKEQFFYKLARANKINRSTVYNRMNRGWQMLNAITEPPLKTARFKSIKIFHYWKKLRDKLQCE